MMPGAEATRTKAVGARIREVLNDDAQRSTSCYYWGTVGQALEAANISPLEHYPSGGATSRDLDKPEWHGTDSFEAANRIATEGVPASRMAAQAAREAALESFGATRGHRYRLENQVQGGAVDVQAWLRGDPRAMLRPRRVEAPRRVSRVIRLNVDMAASHAIKAEDMLTAGARVVALVDILRVLGYSADVMISATVANGSETAWHGFTVARATEELDLDSITYWLAHPSAFRRHMFSLMEHMTKTDRRTFNVVPHGGYGRPAQTPQPVLERFEVNADLGNAGQRVQELRTYTDAAWLEMWLERLEVRG